MSREIFRAQVPFAVRRTDTVHRANTTAACVFEGYASVFSVLITDAPEPTIIERGAFAATLADSEQRRRVKVCWQHEEAIGRPLELFEDHYGLFIRAQLSTTARALEAAQLLRDRVVTEMSIGFEPVDWFYRGSVRHLTQIRLLECSLVNWGANKAAVVTKVVHQQPEDEFEKQMRELEQLSDALRDRQMRDLELDYLEALLRRSHGLCDSSTSLER